MTLGAVLLLATLAAVAAFGAWRAMTDGRFRRPAAAPAEEQQAAAEQPAEPTVAAALTEAGLADSLGERATLLQFSSAFCAPCRATRRVLADVADVVPGIAHVEVDAEAHLDLVRELGILRTPTTLVLDAAGHEVTRAAGPPRKEQVLSALPIADPT